jgi:hypothetical protein
MFVEMLDGELRRFEGVRKVMVDWFNEVGDEVRTEFSTLIVVHLSA